MLSSVLNIVAKPLEHALRTYQRQEPKSQEVEPLLRALKENIPLSRRTGGADHSELESWTGAHGPNNTAATGGFPATIRNTVQSLVQWAQNPPVNGMPPPYTHRQILAALKMLGARRLLSILLEELKNHNEGPSASIAYDVVTALVCAPDVTSEASTSAATSSLQDAAGAFGAPEPPQRRITLREALKFEADDWKRIQKADSAMAETVVRLYRRVEAQMVPPPAPPPMLQPELAALGGDEMALGDAIAAAAAAGDQNMDAMSLDTTGLDAGADLGLGGDLGGLASATGSTGGLDLQGDDIFGGLSTTDFGADFGSWESMSMEMG
jgi:mediator of RNA polymerase II transcription subunit 5